MGKNKHKGSSWMEYLAIEDKERLEAIPLEYASALGDFHELPSWDIERVNIAKQLLDLTYEYTEIAARNSGNK